MSATLTVIWWRDIPAQIVAKDRRQSHKIVLHPRFQVAIDRAAKQAGLEEWGAYLEQWRKEQRICSDDVKAEAEAEALRLETDYPKEVLNRLVQTGGFAEAAAETMTAPRRTAKVAASEPAEGPKAKVPAEGPKAKSADNASQPGPELP